MTDLKQIEDTISNLSLLDAAELVKRLENRLGVSASQPVVATVHQAVEPTIEEKTEFTVILKSSGLNKINVIKAVREVTSLGLKEAKDLVDSIPKPVKENVSKEEAEAISNKLSNAGAIVELQ